MKTKKQKKKYVFVVGGVMSGVGKGISASSMGKILQHAGYSVSAVKIDPYVNVDAGTMNPVEHGETFVLSDGYETDQDMGNYERFLDTTLTRDSYMTTGSIYQHVINKERSLGYKGKTVSVVPHVPLAVIDQIKRASKKQNAEITIIEIGGTVGEYENILFLEAARMMKRENPDDVAVVLVSYLPIPSTLGEMKSKPTQQAIRTLQESGVFPDIIIGRSEREMDKPRKEKIAAASMLHSEDIISAPDLDSIYDIPKYFADEGLDSRLLKKLKLKKKSNKQAKLSQLDWQKFVKSSKRQKNTVNIAIVGKYFNTGDFVLSDAYVSVIEALKYAGYSQKTQVKMTWLPSIDFENKTLKLAHLKKYDGILIPGGFGNNGIDGKDMVIGYARKNKIPFLGLCLGMQRAAVEFAQNVCGLKNAESDERNIKNSLPVITTITDQVSKIADGKMGGTMRLGSYDAVLKQGTLAGKIYGTDTISERHRHRYELNPKYVEVLEKHGMVISGYSPDGLLPEIIELDKKLHPFFIAVQF
ncbi:MAG: CTP synthase, partial [Candidatus Pacebacteria bacterium]|nr:CTP synthase [Candidatus Paceibacterota bacterium]